MSSAEFEPMILKIERPQTYASHSMAIGIGVLEALASVIGKINEVGKIRRACRLCLLIYIQILAHEGLYSMELVTFSF